MRLPLLAMIILFIVNIASDGYIYYIIKSTCKVKWPLKAYLISTVLLFLYLIVIALIPKKSVDNDGLIAIMWMLYVYFTIYLPKYLFILFKWLSLIPRLWHGKPAKWVSILGIVIAVCTFTSMLWGAFVTRTQTEIVEVNMQFPNLPKSFDGYKIVQISDLHVGSYGRDTTFISEVVNEINSLKPDVILFTGDIVNRKTTELLPFVAPLSRLKAIDGVYSILGNHDYGDYMQWKNAVEKDKNQEQLLALQHKMGWVLLNNDYRVIKNGSDSIIIIGVENWGEPPFKIYGDLSKAYKGLNDNNFKVLLTHNSNHWLSEVVPNTNIDLSLSGHTHAMQIQITLFGKKYSPATFRYDLWGGAYENGAQRLYVNIGIGEVAVPMRIGATPEITLITLQK